ncbi:MAG: polysaccharide biosynthesis tyrosine autokinase [Lachnospiraceae bacterium]|uniref:polysaccharide biosynthesis tyrosine autokinase n=1 Tax=Parablautia sp. Marseille-Q6255 TaxID=3039593 RepID=UPI0024BC9B7A|nr:polysaccharide biosynthesis tyrosine autokinase [Parablautia sp. Marseille-Q6255]
MAKIEIKTDALNYECDEAFKALRTNLQFCGDDKKVIVFTSCTPDEGKSTVVHYLAMSLANTGKHVLLIDADLRKSVMAGNYRIPETLKGLSHFLSGQAPLEDVLCNTDIDTLNVILAGPMPPNPSELLAGETFHKLLGAARETYDYILIDCPPLGSVIDAAIAAKYSDGAVIVVEAETISYRFVQEIKEQLEKGGCPILGVVLNKVDIRGQKYYYNYYNKYGKYGKKYGYGKYTKYYGDSETKKK